MRIREIKKNKPSKPRDPNFQAMQNLRKSGAAGSHGDKTKDIPRKEKHKGKAYDINTDESGIMYRAGVKKYGKAGMKAIQSAAGKGASHQEIGKIKDKHLKDEVGETATPGATSAGNIATVANPHIANSKAKPKKQKPTDNALDNKSHGLFGQPLKRLNNSKETQMKSKDLIQENLADEASKVEQDHEVQMARAQLYKIAKYSIKLHEMLKHVSEQEGLEGWVQSKITKASDYIGAVYHNMDYEQKFEQVSENINEAKACNCNEDCACGGNCTPDCNCGPNCNESVKEEVLDEKDPCWKGYKQIGMKKKGKKEVPNCVPEDYTSSLADRLEAEKSEYVYEKQKGVDGKVCWKGYKRMGTKKKGGKTVDNCVKM